MKTKKELNTLKKEAEPLNKKPRTLTDEELEQVTGGVSLYNYWTMEPITVSNNGDESAPTD